MEKFISKTLLFLLLILTACSRSNGGQPTGEILSPRGTAAPPERILASSPTPEHTTTPQVTMQPTMMLTPTWRPTITLTPTPAPAVIPACDTYGSVGTAQADFAFPGVIVYRSLDEYRFYALAGNLSESIHLSALDMPGFFFVDFSPDGRWAAFFNREAGSDDPLKDRFALLLGKDGERIEHQVDLTQLSSRIPDYLALVGLTTAHWINNELLNISFLLQTPPIGPQNTYAFSDVLDPFSGTLRADILEQIPYFQREEVVYGFMLAFSPDMRYLLYQHSNIFEGWVALHDFVEGEVVFKDQKLPLTSEGLFIRWSPDSQSVAYANNQVRWGYDWRFILLHPDGMVRKEITKNLPSYEELYFPEFAWSSNSRYLALLGKPLSGTKTTPATVYIYDRELNQWTARCEVGTAVLGTPLLVWSPDSRYVAINRMQDNEDHTQSRITIFDIETNQLYLTEVMGSVTHWREMNVEDWR
jgi:hypothetical protein